MRTTCAATILLLANGVAAFAQTQPPTYLDDRSDPGRLVESYYNAINRGEFGRAWSYYGDLKPGADLDMFARGFDDTESVTVVVGRAGVEGAAGSTFFSLPVAITAHRKDGSDAVFGGCYTLRLANPQVQRADFRPMHIERATLHASDGPMAESMPTDCGGGTAQPADAVLEQARVMFSTLHAGQCTAIPADGTADAPESYLIPWRHHASAEDEPEQEARLLRFLCDTGAYNEGHVYYLWKEAEGLRQLQFATPELDIRYENDDEESPVESLGIIGYTAEAQLMNSAYDADTKTLTSAAKWRGVGDASSSGTWIFRDGDFTLVKYDVDASYDGEINPEMVLDFHTGP
jgi:hypothetical protein